MFRSAIIRRLGNVYGIVILSVFLVLSIILLIVLARSSQPQPQLTSFATARLEKCGSKLVGAANLAK